MWYFLSKSASLTDFVLKRYPLDRISVLALGLFELSRAGWWVHVLHTWFNCDGFVLSNLLQFIKNAIDFFRITRLCESEVSRRQHNGNMHGGTARVEDDIWSEMLSFSGCDTVDVILFGLLRHLVDHIQTQNFVYIESNLQWRVECGPIMRFLYVLESGT